MLEVGQKDRDPPGAQEQGLSALPGVGLAAMDQALRLTQSGGRGGRRVQADTSAFSGGWYDRVDASPAIGPVRLLTRGA